MRRQFALLAALGLSMLLGTGCSQDTAVSSPDGGLTLRVAEHDGRIGYTLSRGETLLLDFSTLGFELRDAPALRDGLTIEGYLTLPAGLTMETARQLPVVVNPHGGPWARDSWGYNPEVQFLANRGYAVLQMNFRGSTGYGRKFKELSYKQWGQTMQNDITDGVRWLISQGIAD